MTAGPQPHRTFPPISACSTTSRHAHAVAADLDGTLLVSSNSFPYFMLLAISAGSFARGLLLLALSPMILFLYRLVSEAAGIHLMIFVSVAGIPAHRIRRVARTVLPRFYAADVREDSWKAFRACGRRRVIVTANPVEIVEPFCKGWLGADAVLGTELHVDRWTGRATGLLKNAVLVGDRKKEALLEEFKAEVMPEIGLGDRETDHDFMALCKEGYMVPPNRKAAKAPLGVLNDTAGPTAFFHDGRLVRRPKPHTALLTYMWLPFGLALALFRLCFTFVLPVRHLRAFYRLTGVKLVIRGKVPPKDTTQDSLLVCNRRSPIDIELLSSALGRPVAAADAKTDISDVAVFPEGAPCREDLLLAFDQGMSHLEFSQSRQVVPTAVRAEQWMFHPTTGASSGWRRWTDSIFFFMNPRPTWEVTFLEPLPESSTCKGGKSPAEVAKEAQRVLSQTLGYQCSELSWKDREEWLHRDSKWKSE